MPVTRPARLWLSSALTIGLCLLASTASADEEQSPYAYVKASASGRTYFKMAPSAHARHDRNQGRGVAYAVTQTGPDEVLWETSGWYAFRVFLSTDGQHLVRLGNWPRGRTPAAKHLGIAFYDRGKLTRKYSSKELICDHTKVRPSKSHYRFLDKVIGFDAEEKRFTVIAVDKTRWTFDVKTGEVVEGGARKTSAP